MGITIGSSIHPSFATVVSNNNTLCDGLSNELEKIKKSMEKGEDGNMHNESIKDKCEKLLKIYKLKTEKNISNNKREDRESIIEEDKNIIAMRKLIDTFEEEGNVSYDDFNIEYFITAATQKKLDDRMDYWYNKGEELNMKIDEVKALLEVAETYDQAINILREYGILSGLKIQE